MEFSGRPGVQTRPPKPRLARAHPITHHFNFHAPDCNLRGAEPSWAPDAVGRKTKPRPDVGEQTAQKPLRVTLPAATIDTGNKGHLRSRRCDIRYGVDRADNNGFVSPPPHSFAAAGATRTTFVNIWKRWLEPHRKDVNKIIHAGLDPCKGLNYSG